MNATRKWLRVVPVAVLLLTVAACGDDDDAAPTTGPQAVVVDDVWARASAMMQDAGAVYFDVTGGAEDDRLIGASVSADVAAMVEIHETVEAEMPGTTMGMATGSTMGHGMGAGPMRMQEVDSVEIPAGVTVRFVPGGYHVMLLQLAQPLEVGSTFDLTLVFEKAGEVVVVAEVIDP